MPIYMDPLDLNAELFKLTADDVVEAANALAASEDDDLDIFVADELEASVSDLLVGNDNPSVDVLLERAHAKFGAAYYGVFEARVLGVLVPTR